MAEKRFKRVSLLADSSRITQAPASSSDLEAYASMVRDLNSLYVTWSLIRATLMEAEDMEIEREHVKDWLRELRRLSYDVEDVLDCCEYELLRIEIEGEQGGTDERERCVSTTLSLLENAVFQHDVPQMANTMDNTIQRIGELREALELKEWDGKDVIGEAPHATGAENEPSMGSFPSQQDVFGRKHDVDTLVALLENKVGDKNKMLNDVHVIAVVGMGGVGKTTLVQKVYDSVETFDIKGWTCVSENYDIVSITKETLNSFTGGSHSFIQLDTLQRKLRAEVAGKKFLLVLDDIWNDSNDCWDNFLTPLRYGGEGSQVLITTRNISVVNALRVKQPYKLDCLSEEDSLLLFQQCAFNGNNSIELEAMGKRIVQKCKGLPLAIKVLGRLLWHSKDSKRWKQVLGSDIYNVDKEEKKILGPLLFSYNHLSFELKQCFKFCAMFPKDERIVKEHLISLWMANDLIKPCDGGQLEDTGMGYIDELLSRSFFQFYSFGKDKVVHDLIHDLALYISEEECQTKVLLDEGYLEDLKLSAEARHSLIKCPEENVVPLKS